MLLLWGVFFVGGCMNQKDKQLLRNLIYNNSITLKSFLISHCGIYQKELLEDKISHDDIKCLFPYLKRSSFEYILTNIREVYIGNILLVRDSYNNTVPYLKPKLNEITDIEINEEECIDKSENSEDDSILVDEIENLTLYELIELRKKYKTQNRCAEYRRISKIIKRNSDVISNREYYKKKVLMKGFDENDKY